MDPQALAAAFSAAMSRWTPLAVTNVVALALSPLIAVLVTLWYQQRRERRNSQVWVFNSLIGNRHTPLNHDAIRALNLIDVVFHDNAKVRQLWREYLDMLGNQGLANPQGFQQRQTKNLEMITEMAKALGYGRTITHLDIDRIYYPQGLVNYDQRGEDIANELLRVLRNTEAFQASPRLSDITSVPSPARLPPST